MRMKFVSEKHIFALYYHQASLIKTVSFPAEHTIVDDALFHRIKNVLRFEVGDQIVLFDYMTHLEATITQIDKKKCVVMLTAQEINKSCTPNITVLLPVLKKDSLETAVYNLTQLGVNTIQLVLTQKVQRKWHGASERERLEKVVQSAAEQAKQYTGTLIQEPQSLEQVLTRYTGANDHLLYMDPQGASLLTLLATPSDNRSFVILVGPEGDLTAQEKDAVQSAGFTFYRLTPTILKAVDAVALAAGIVRSLR